MNAFRALTPSAMSGSKERRTRRTGRRDPLAVKLLKDDHREVEGMFDEYEQLDADSRRCFARSPSP